MRTRYPSQIFKPRTSARSCREEACNTFVTNIKASYRLYPFIHKQLSALNHDCSLRLATTERQTIIRTDRFESFTAVKCGKTELIVR